MTEIMINVIDRAGEKHSIAWEPDQSLMEALRDNDLPVLASCGGCCSCATCHVFVDPSRIIEPSEGEERELLEETEAFRPACSRLACQIAHDPSHAGMTVALAPEE